MGNVLRLGAFRVVIYSHDHPPPHVHVLGPNGEAVFNLNCPDGPPTQRGARGLSAHQRLRIIKELAPRMAELCAKWRETHGS